MQLFPLSVTFNYFLRVCTLHQKWKGKPVYLSCHSETYTQSNMLHWVRHIFCFIFSTDNAHTLNTVMYYCHASEERQNTIFLTEKYLQRIIDNQLFTSIQRKVLVYRGWHSWLDGEWHFLIYPSTPSPTNSHLVGYYTVSIHFQPVNANTVIVLTKSQ